MAKKKIGKLPHVYVIALILLCVIIGVLFVINRPKNSEEMSQIDSSEKNEWPEKYFFGEEDREKFPAISKPKYVDSSIASQFLTDSENVYIFEAGGKRYVYPEKVLAFHHIVNDIINDTPVAVTLCLLTDSAGVYKREIDGSTLIFGTLAILYNGNLVMFDDKTDSYWLQLTGDAIKGRLRGNRLESFARIDYAKWGKIKNLPQLKILPPVKDMPFYENFYKLSMKSNLGLFAIGKQEVPKTYSEYTQGLGIKIGDEAKFYKLETIHGERVIEDEVGNWSLLLVSDEVTGAAKIFRRAIDNRILTFKKSGIYLQDDQTKSKWNMDGVAIDGKLKGKSLKSPFYMKVYWFAWWALFPSTMNY